MEAGATGTAAAAAGGWGVGDAEMCAHVCAWGALHAADQAGRRGGIGRRQRRQGGAVAVTQGWWQPPRAGCSRRGEVTGGRDRCALFECARQSSSDAMVTCVRGDGRGRAAARAYRGLSLDGEWGGRESSQARVPVMRDDIDSWSRPRLAERLRVVGLRAHVPCRGRRPSAADTSC